jgi:hypothetical protein
MLIRFRLCLKDLQRSRYVNLGSQEQKTELRLLQDYALGSI